jgi:hypothetical protein
VREHPLGLGSARTSLHPHVECSCQGFVRASSDGQRALEAHGYRYRHVFAAAM